METVRKLNGAIWTVFAAVCLIWAVGSTICWAQGGYVSELGWSYVKCAR